MSQSNSREQADKHRLGTLALMLLAVAGCGHDTSGPGADAARVRLYYVGGRGNATLRVSASAGTVTESATVGASDAVTLVSGLRATDTVEIRVEETGPAPARFHPAVAVLTGTEIRQVQRFVLIPRRWTITATASPCRYAGQTVAIDLGLAYKPSVADPSSFYLRVPNAGDGWSYRAEAFPASVMPIPVAFDRTASTDAISASDSAGFWSAVADLESSVCQNVFQPAMSSAVSAARGVRVVLDRDLDATARGGPTMGEHRGATAFISGVIICRNAACLTSGTVPQHELLHVLGFGHTCAWPSVMRAGCAGETRPSAHDVAYFQVYYAARALQLSARAQHSLAAGHRSSAASGEAIRDSARQIVEYE